MEKDQTILPVFFDDERLFTPNAIEFVLGHRDYQIFSKFTNEVEKLASKLAKENGKEFSKLLVNEAFELQDRAKIIFFKEHPYLVDIISSCEHRLKKMSKMIFSLEEQTPVPPLSEEPIQKSKGK